MNQKSKKSYGKTIKKSMDYLVPLVQDYTLSFLILKKKVELLGVANTL